MTAEITQVSEKVEKVKNPKRVAAGKKSVEARLRNAEARKKESERLRKENLKLKEITKVDDDEEIEEIKEINIYKNYIPICLAIIGVVVGGLYYYKNKKKEPEVVYKPQVFERKKEIDPFEFR